MKRDLTNPDAASRGFAAGLAMPLLGLPAILWLLCGAHLLVDIVATLVLPLWPRFEAQLQLPRGAEQTAYIWWSLASSFSQLAFGWFGDRLRFNWLIWAGPALAVVAIASLGVISTSFALYGLLATAGIGIAAFHPEAAAMAGESAPQHRARAVSIFVMGGFVGQSLGPLVSGALTDRWGLLSLTWTVPWVLAPIALVALGLKRFKHVEPSASAQDTIRQPGNATLLLSRWRTVVALLLVGTLRVTPMAGIPLATAYVLTGEGFDKTAVGFVQSMFMIGVGLGVLGCGLWVRPQLERRTLWLAPLATVPLQLICVSAGYGWLAVLSGLCGLAFGLTQPILISQGQHLFPGAARLANSVTMGASWGLGGVLVSGAIGLARNAGHPTWVFYELAVCTLLACVSSVLLPDHQAEVTAAS